MLKYFLTIILLILHANAFAQVFKITITDYGGIDSVPGLKQLLDREVEQLEDKLNDKLPNGSKGRILKSMANANVMVGKNIGSDYSSHMNIWMVGASLNGAVDLHKEGASDISGFGLAPGFNAGVNLGAVGVEDFGGLDADRLDFYFNFLRISREQQVYERDDVEADARIKSSSIGFRFRYQWIEAEEKKNFGWGGVKLHWGYQYTDSTYTVTGDVDTVLEVSNTDGTVNGTVTGQPKVKLNAQTHSIPLEISTEYRMFYVLSVFGGLGADISTGRAKGKVDANADVSPLLCTGGGFCGGGKLVQVSAEGNLDTQKYISNVIYRGFGGLQLNLPYFNLYTMVDKAIGRDLLGVSVGLRFVY